jgi:hypothetical protein
MASDDLVTYLRLTPEFGGTRFGPFEGLEARLGSNAERCHIVLPESLGIRAEHCKVIRQGPENLILAPSERTAAVFLYKGQATRPVQLNTPTAVRPGDSFALVTPDGPRFVVELDELPPEVKQARQKARGGMRKRLSAEAIGGEVKRQAWTRLLVLAPAQFAQRAWVYIQSGAIYQPRNIILFLTIAGGWIFGGVSACRIGSFKTKSLVAESQVESCKQELAFADDLSGSSEELKFEQLAARITGVTKVGQALEEDDNLRSAVKQKAKVLFGDANSYTWLVTGTDKRATEFSDWRERVLEETDIDADSGRLLVWLAADPRRNRSDFDEVLDSFGDPVCGRGPIRMTYRQALHLGVSAQADALVRGDYQAMPKADWEALLVATIGKAGGTPPEGTFESNADPLRQGGAACLYILGEDDRSKVNMVIKSMKTHLGPSSEFLPTTDVAYSPVARVAKYWAADLDIANFERKEGAVDFTGRHVGTVLDALDARGKWVLDRTAETVARSIVLPCLAVLTGDKREIPKVFGEQLPSPVSCLVLDWRLRNDG